MKTLVIGGTFDKNTPKASKIITSLSEYLKAESINGGRELPIDISGNDLVIWAPNVDNGIDKVYPKKDQGAVLVVSKVIGNNGRIRIDAVKRIFDFSGNAVIAIDKSKTPFEFSLIDALNNEWARSTSIEEIATQILTIFEWTKASKRVRSVRLEGSYLQATDEKRAWLNLPLAINTKLSQKVVTAFGQRYFGNISTRCMQLFPSRRIESGLIYVSPRNSNKEILIPEDMVLAHLTDGLVGYYGDKKPSVDTAVQLNLYKQFSDIRFMIHGHAFVKGAPYTNHYFPCGDLREVQELVPLIEAGEHIINLKNHGFLMWSYYLEALEHFVNESEIEIL